MAERWRVLPAGANAATQAGLSQVLAVHAALLATGKVLYFGGSQHLYDDTLRPINDPRLDNTRLWDPETGIVETLPSPQPLYDLFCCGHAFLPDGKLLLAGGTSGYPHPDSDNHHEHYRGSRRSARFDPHAAASRPWLPTADLNQHPDFGGINPDGTGGGGGRWYPTLVALGDGSVAVFGGHPQEADNRHSNTSVEVFSPPASGPGVWVQVHDEPDAAERGVDALRIPEVYPRAHLLPNGRVFIACLADAQSHSWDPYLRPSRFEGGWEQIAAFPSGTTADPSSWETTYFDTGRRNYNRTFFAWSSVLLPLLPEQGYAAKVLIAGRAQPFFIDLGGPNGRWPPSAAWQPTGPRDRSRRELFEPSRIRHGLEPETEFPGRGFIDLTGANLRFTNLVGMRQQCTAVLLPDGTVLVLGGSTTHPSDWSGYFFDGVRLPEVYDPAHNTWRTVPAEAQVPRVYHGVALLLADGRVWTAGSNPFGDGNRADRELRIEVFEPWYFDRPRPAIADAPADVRYGVEFQVSMREATDIHRVALIRASSATHGFVFDQRYIGLNFRQIAPDHLRITAPPDFSIAPPGYYLLFIIDEAGVPSIGKFLRVKFGWQPWFALGANEFALDAPVTAVSTRPHGTSLFLVGLDGEGRGGGNVWSAFFPNANHSGEWSSWFPLGENVFRPGARVAALSLSEGATSLYITGLDGRVWSNFFPRPNGHPEWFGWFPIGVNNFPLGADIAAVSPRPGATSLFIVGLDNEGRGGGQVWSAFFPDPRSPGHWSPWFAIGENVFRPGASLTALSLSGGSTSLYVIGLDGRVWSNFFPRPDGRREWFGWFPIGPNVFPPDATVTAVSTRSGETSLFVVGLDNVGRGGGRVWSAFFPDAERPGEWSPWFPLGDNVFRPGARVAALSLSAGATSLYVMGLDGRAWSNFFPRAEGTPQWSGWFPVGPNVFPVRGEVAAMSSKPGGTSLFVVGRDRHIWSTFFDPTI